MPSKITMHKIENTIAAAQTAGTTFSKAIRGRILSIKVIFSNTTPANSSDRDVNLFEMNPFDPLDTADALQEFLDIGTLGAAPADDNGVYYPRADAQDITGAVQHYNDEADEPVKIPFMIFGRLMLSVTAAAAGDITTLYVMVEEY